MIKGKSVRVFNRKTIRSIKLTQWETSDFQIDTFFWSKIQSRVIHVRTRQLESSFLTIIGIYFDSFLDTSKLKLETNLRIMEERL